MIIFGSLGGALHKDVCNMSSGGLWPASCSSLCLSINAFMKQLLASIFQFENCTFVLQLVFQKKTAMQKGRMCFLQTEFFFFFLAPATWEGPVSTALSRLSHILAHFCRLLCLTQIPCHFCRTFCKV